MDKAVTIDQPERMNLLGLMLGDIIGRNLETQAGARALRQLSGNVVVGAGSMFVTLRFANGALAIVPGADHRAAGAEVHGSLDALVRMATGGNMVTPVLSGKLRVRGNLLTLLRMRPLLQT